MAILKKNAFSRRVPDLVTEELVAVLSRRSSFEFKQLFDIVHENLRARNAASGGEEMLRLRAYEKLQNLVARGAVKKNGIQTFIRWAHLGVWERLLLLAQERGVQLGMTFLDGTSIRAHHKAAGAEKGGQQQGSR